MSEESLFLEALDTPAGERSAFLDRACDGDPRMRSRLDQLLAAVDRPDGVLERGTDLRRRGAALAVDELFAGRFKLRQKLGEGGMGEVWVADQSEPVRRRVAVKMIRPGLDSARLIARFDQERQALAAMDHPNIAKVLDAGVAAGRPYFVMDLIKGVPITKYCDDAKLSPRERLALFIPVCQAVQHAHQKGIIHRDLKPSNIMVALYDGVPVPKVIDFGVAKATGPRFTEESVYTEVGSLVGTVEYMSPEQAELNNLDIDTRSDVYALGVVLYELLTGTVPIPRERLRSASFVEMLRIIKEDAPPKPSTRLSQAETRVDVATVRRTPPGKLAATVRGDLDWIVMKCLEKERARRYDTANGLAADLSRFLANEPVLASPPTTAYRLRKFLGRNRGAAIAGTLLFVALLAGVVGTGIGLVKARQARDDERERAEGERVAKEEADRRADGERAAKQEARERLAQFAKGIDLLSLVFEDLHPRTARPDTPLRVVLADRLVAAAKSLDAVGDPLVVARLQNRIGMALTNLGSVREALPILVAAHATRERLLGETDRETLTSANNLAGAYKTLGRIPVAEAMYTKLVDHHRREHGEEDPDTMRAMNNLAGVYRSQGRREDTLRLYKDVLRLRHDSPHLGPTHEDTLTSMNNLAVAHQDLRETKEAGDLYRKALELRKIHRGPTHYDTIQSMVNLGGFLAETGGDLTEAIKLQREGLRLYEAELGETHPEAMAVLTNLSASLFRAGEADEGMKMQERALSLRRRTLEPNHPELIDAVYFTGTALVHVKRPEKALPLYREAAVGVESMGYRHRNAPDIVPELCRCLEEFKYFDEAELWRRKWLDGAAWHDTPANPTHAVALGRLSANLVKQKRYAEAETYAVQSYDELKNPKDDAARAAPARRQALANTLDLLVRVTTAAGKPDDAARWRKELDELRGAKK